MPSPQAQEPKGSKKPRKPRAQPQLIDEPTWKAVEAAICIGGLGYSEAARKFGIEPHAIMMKAKRHGWAVPSRIAERTKALQARYKACESDRNSNEEVIQAVAQSWAERGEQHRLLAFQLAHDSLKTAAKRGLPIEDWRDADLADKTARRKAPSAGESNFVAWMLEFAAALSKSHCVPLVILDLSMPRMDGLEVQTIMNELSPALRVIIITARDDNLLHSAAMKAVLLISFLNPSTTTNCCGRCIVHSAPKKPFGPDSSPGIGHSGRVPRPLQRLRRMPAKRKPARPCSMTEERSATILRRTRSGNMS